MEHIVSISMPVAVVDPGIIIPDCQSMQKEEFEVLEVWNISVN
jgi:hypothetical protein